jgi:multidrug transporter EmrE-like cation transporter
MSWAMTANAVGIAFILAISHALLRHGAALGQEPLEFPRIAYTLAAMLIYVAIFFYYSQLLQRFALSRLYPIYSALSIVFVYVFGTLFFREPLSLRGLFGTALVITGVLVVAADRQP